LHGEAKLLIKKSWTGSGNQNSVFSMAPIMKPKLLDPWTLSRVQAPEKASTKFFFSKTKPWTYTKGHTREFNASGDELLSQRQRDLLEK